ncbi:CFI-box-CTERM domain-containing protein [Cupriavidus basilensis]|uniref:CFI-box-CTERM domain-containing protein n=1 Tax=Cupriavidus basilensis TaxID=68895 RepID=UPI003D343545
MKPRRTSVRRAPTVSASELAQMGVCERLVVFEHRLGKRKTVEQQSASERGIAAHAQFYQEGLADAARKGRCYIATAVYGEGWQTTALRFVRDCYLRPHSAGRWMIAAYYRSSPGICRVLERHPWWLIGARWLLYPAAWAAHCLYQRTRRSQ